MHDFYGSFPVLKTPRSVTDIVLIHSVSTYMDKQYNLHGQLSVFINRRVTAISVELY